MDTTEKLLIAILIFIFVWSVFIIVSLKNVYEVIKEMQKSFRDNNRETELRESVHFDCLKWRLYEIHDKVINGLDPVTLEKEDEEDNKDNDEEEEHQWFRIE